MMEWIRRMLAPRRQTPVVVAKAPPANPALAREQRRHKELLNRADRTIHEAMAHADEMFTPNGHYRGPERRHTQR